MEKRKRKRDNRKVTFLQQIITTRYYQLLLITVFLALFFFFLRPPTDPDLGWHLRYGQMMVENHQLPRVDTFSYTMSGYSWADSWWLSEILIYGGYKLFGFVGLAVIFSLIAAAALLLPLVSRPEGCVAHPSGLRIFLFREERFKFIFILFMSLLLIISFVGIRPQTISLLFFSVTLWWLSRGRLNPSSGGHPQACLPARQGLFLPLLFLVWANFHAGFVLGLALVWLNWLGRALASLTRRVAELNPTGFPRRDFFRLSVSPILCTLVTLINPYGFSLWQSIGQDAASVEIKQAIAEWAPTVFRSDLGVVYFSVLLVFFLLLGRRLREEPLSFLLPAFFFTFLSLASLRHIPLWAVMVAPFFSRAWPERFLPRAPYFFLWLFLTFLGVALFGLANFLQPWLAGQWANRGLRGFSGYPQGAAAYLEKHPPRGHVLNTYGWGGYLLWQLPDFKTFIDGRMPGWRYLGQPSLFSEYLTAVNLKPGWEAVLRKYQVAWVILEKNQPLPQALVLIPAWHKVYEDNLAVVLKKD